MKDGKVKAISSTTKTLNDMNEKLADAEKVGSFLITITTKKEDKLSHWQGYINFPKEDVAHSLREQLKLAPSAYNLPGKVRRFKPME